MRRSAEKGKTKSPLPKKTPNLHIGTSGWSYGGWDNIFYPEGVKTTYDRLAFYAQHFDTVEVNYSFYHLPKPETYKRWAEAVPKGFIFAVKASRFITHIKKLEGVEEAWVRFIMNAQVLGNQLGPILFQLPPSLHADQKRLTRFLSLLRRDATAQPICPVFEFRHPSWFTKTTYVILRENRASLCIAQSSRYPYAEEITSDLVYYRFHGPEELFASRYSDEELRSWAERIKPLLDSGKTVYVYFNNDLYGYAVENARILRGLIEK